MVNKQSIVLAAGGTGGHLFPALALAQVLAQRDLAIYLFTDKRAAKYLQQASWPCYISDSFIIESGGFSKNPLKMGRALLANLYGYYQAKKLLRRLRPLAVGGFGGYPTLAPLLAARSLGCASFIHEQNSVMGRANKLLAPFATKIAGGFLADLPAKWQDKLVITGNPLRDGIHQAAQKPYQAWQEGEKFHLLIFGGSQGASFFSEILPQSCNLLSAKERQRLKITQQSRGDATSLQQHYKALNIEAEIAPFFPNLAQLMADAHFIISRSGALSVSEIAAIGRPSLLIPYPYALDHDQAENAKSLAAKGGAFLLRQQDISASSLAAFIRRLWSNPQLLPEQARLAKKFAIMDAHLRLADLVSALIAADNYRG